ncbi:MAG: 16S rRNA (guanine(966)-N(2))-methyltransferase RsmD [Gammaproteobacteria bacterium]|nr:MAG: 16S rRNA (guanine(966)-N(2))-methyltransferase RsmD [Gammaproteobacteria bacterium]
MTRRSHSRPRVPEKGFLRIIGGKYRGRKLTFPVVDGVRPTPDRVRETLFNWLMHAVPGSRCLDLFSGSGALGLEALSRGACQVTLVERSATLARYLEQTAGMLNPEAQLHVVQADVASWLAAGAASPYDILFMDPPFRQGWLPRLLPLLEQGGWVAPGAWIYIEHETDCPVPLPSNWQIHREKVAGQVCSTLCRAGDA